MTISIHTVKDLDLVVRNEPWAFARDNSERIEAFRKQMSQARREFVCESCGFKEWGPPGLRHPADWEFHHMLDFCPTCTSTKTLKELMNV